MTCDHEKKEKTELKNRNPLRLKLRGFSVTSFEPRKIEKRTENGFGEPTNNVPGWVFQPFLVFPRKNLENENPEKWGC